MKISISAICITAIAFLLSATVQVACAAEEPMLPRHILLLNSYHQDMTWVKDIVRAVKDELEPGRNNLVLHIENMDSKRFHSDSYIKSLYLFYREKYRQTHFSLILASDNNAYDFLRQYRDYLFPGVPVVFCGVNFFQSSQLAGLKDFTGVEEVFDAAATLKIAQQLFPATRDVFIINDYLKTGRAWEKTIRQQLTLFSSKLHLRYAKNLSLAELSRQIGQLKPGSIVLLGVYFSDREGHYATYERIGAMLASASKVPVFCLLEFNVGKGVLGGNVISGYSQGWRMAAIGKRILGGEPAGRIPVVRTGTNQNIFDYGQLQRFGIDDSLLPDKRQIINRPFSFYREYHDLIMVTAAFISLLLLTILALLISMKRRRLAQQQLRASERKFKTIFNHSHDFIGLVRPDGTLLEANQTAIDFTGRSKEDLLDRPFWETDWWEHSPKAQDRLREAIQRAATGVTVKFETTHSAPDGSLHTFDMAITPVLDELGRVALLIPEARDISELKRIEHQLKESEDFLRLLIEQSPVGLALSTMDGTLLSANSSFEKIIGYSNKEILALSHGDITPEKYAAADQRQLEQLAANGRYGPYEKEYRHKDGHLVPVRLNGMRIIKEGRSYIWSSVEDITALKESETEKNTLAEQLRHSQKMEAIGTLAGGVAHDFNNILSAVIGFTQLTLRNPNCDAKSKRNLNHVLSAAGRAKDLVKQILLFSRKSEATHSQLEIHAVVEDAVRLLRKTIPSSIVIKTEIDKQTGWVLADETQIHQVMMNLCTNACHAVEKEGGRIDISLKPVDIDSDMAEKAVELRPGRYGELTVTDNGAGMSQETTARIFEPFFTTKDQGQGTGMGLAVVHGIIQQHDGAISVASEIGKGTTFRVYFPLLSTPVNIQEPEPLQPHEIAGGNEHILWVDDEVLLVELGKEMLEPLGYRVTCTTSGIEALNLFQSEPNGYNLIVADQTMPEISGDRLAREAMQIRADIPVIICTGHSAVFDEAQALSLGVKAFLTKPVECNQLAEVVRRILDESSSAA